MRGLSIAAVLALFLAPAAASAHKPSDAYLELRVEGAAARGRLDLSLRDLEHAVGLDSDGDGRITWGELRSQRKAVEAIAAAGLAIAAEGGPCPARFEDLRVDRHSDGAYAVLQLSAACPHAPRSLRLDYALFFDQDPLHRGLAAVEANGTTATAILGANSRAARIDLAPEPFWRTLAVYAREGVWHIGIGTDHVLFLLCLLLPAVLVREGGRWAPVPRLRPAALEILRLVTAFTAAHSITLSLAALGLVGLPSRLVESAIAASVLLAALENLRPLLGPRRWTAAFGFGLVHGLGFASVLEDLGLPSASLAPALLGFNLGVEAGQLAIVALFLPLAFATRGSIAYRRLALGAGSALVALVASAWLVERSFDLHLALPL
jgi:hypothetical protein